MPVQVISEDQTSLRAREKLLEIVVNPDDQSAGVVHMTLCELPAGQLEELEGEIREIGENITEINKTIAATTRRKNQIENQISLMVDLDFSALNLELFRLHNRLGELKAKRKELKAERRGLQLELIAWAVCDHAKEDFLRGNAEVPFKESIGTYDGAQYRIASIATVRQYLSVGLTFIEVLYIACTNYQRQIVLKPADIWAEAKKARELIEARIKGLLAESIQKAAEEATREESDEDRLADAGAELADEEADPNQPRPRTKAASEA